LALTLLSGANTVTLSWGFWKVDIRPTLLMTSLSLEKRSWFRESANVAYDSALATPGEWVGFGRVQQE
jgi:hypothetical protein